MADLPRRTSDPAKESARDKQSCAHPLAQQQMDDVLGPPSRATLLFCQDREVGVVLRPHGQPQTLLQFFGGPKTRPERHGGDTADLTTVGVDRSRYRGHHRRDRAQVDPCSEQHGLGQPDSSTHGTIGVGRHVVGDPLSGEHLPIAVTDRHTDLFGGEIHGHDRPGWA